MKRDADGWKQNRSLRRLDLLPLVHPLRLYLDAGMGLPDMTQTGAKAKNTVRGH